MTILLLFHPLTHIIVQYRLSRDNGVSLATFHPFVWSLWKEEPVPVDIVFGPRRIGATVPPILKNFLKGFYPTLILALILSLFGNKVEKSCFSFYLSPSACIIRSNFAWSFVYSLLLSWPLALVYRSIMNPTLEPSLDPRVILKSLTTEYERKNPAVVIDSGVLPTFLCQIVIELYCLPSLRRWLWNPPYASFFGTFGALMFELARVGLGTVVLTPLHVALTRLLVQRRIQPPAPLPKPSSEIEGDGHGDEHPSESDVGPSVSPDDATDEVDETRASSEDNESESQDNQEDGSNDDLYKGLVDCLVRMYKEEGPKHLYRCWWLIFLRLFLRS
ncbi:hypothetical protein DL96DRAFT_1812050 [Flagelloscypha sp. PMI_526]|nr:hypothetical protein DL96DRAFT_1812050 [Flagelloscypha sp. PMI_526]